MIDHLEHLILGALVALGVICAAVLAAERLPIPPVIETVVTLCVGGLAGLAIPRRPVPRRETTK